MPVDNDIFGMSFRSEEIYSGKTNKALSNTLAQTLKTPRTPGTNLEL